MSLQWIIEHEIGYFRGPATVGVIKGETGWILIDSGVEAQVPKKIVKALSLAYPEEVVNISAVINTHAHADHCGGNKWIQANYSAKFYASVGEAPYIENPYIEPHYLFSAASPKSLKNKFFQAEPSLIDCVIGFQGENDKAENIGQEVAINVDGIALTLVNIEGHSNEMMGVLTSSRYFYCGDLLFAPQILEKHPMLFLHDYSAYVKSVKWALEQSFKGVVLTHGGYFENHLELAKATLKRLETNLELVLGSITTMTNEWELHQEISLLLGLEEDFGAWHLNHGVIRSYLSYGLEMGLIKWENGHYAPC